MESSPKGTVLKENDCFIFVFFRQGFFVGPNDPQHKSPVVVFI